jgi:hypothetical protein
VQHICLTHYFSALYAQDHDPYGAIRMALEDADPEIVLKFQSILATMMSLDVEKWQPKQSG